MPVFNATAKFRERKKASMPIVPVPKNVKQSLNIAEMYQNGIAKIEPTKKNCLYDRCYIFEEINYINKGEGEKENFLNQFMNWLKAMNVDFKITIANEYQSVTDFINRLRSDKNADRYPEIQNGLDAWTREKLEESNPNVTTVRYLTVSCRADSMSEALVQLNALDTTIQDMFQNWQGKIVRLNGEERLKCLHSLLRVGKKEEEDYIQLSDDEDAQTWKNDILPKDILQYENYLKEDDLYLSVLFGWKYRSPINSDTFLRSFSHVEFPSFLTLDFAPVPASIINDKLMASHMNNERRIASEEEEKQKKNISSMGPSYTRQRRRDEIEENMDRVSDNNETGIYMNLLIVVTAEDEETLAERVGQMQAIGVKEGVTIETADYTQLKALNTALPFAGRQVDYMRFLLSSSAVAFQPYYAQDVIEPGGYLYGLNRTTKRLIFGNRKLLMNPHGIIIGHTGSGKSVIIKLTEINQTLVSTDDDILILDPQNEFMENVERYGGAYFDLTPKSGYYLNGFETSEAVFHAGKKVQEKFVATQEKYAKSVIAAIMKNIPFTQEHASVVSRCTRRMFQKIFRQKKLKEQPTLKKLREEFREELEGLGEKHSHDLDIILSIYNSLEEYTEGGCDMLSYPSTVSMENRLIGFGMKNIPQDNWEAVMLTIMHYTSARMEYNQELQRATHFIVDETQVVARKGTSAEQLCDAVVTFRKFGGICTMAMQNLTAALGNEKLRELFSNCSYKCFLDQGGADANALAEIQEFSETEFNALSSERVGQGVMVWGKKILLFDAEISKKNPLYASINTNFHEKAAESQEGTEGARNPEELRGDGTASGHPVIPQVDREEEIILQMAEFAAITVRDILMVLDITQENAEKKLEYLCEQDRLLRIEEDSGAIRYKKVSG